MNSSFARIISATARLTCLVAFLSLTLFACGGQREIQHDGTGTDEMLKSPCVCLPVPYQPRAYEWGRG